MNNNSPQRSGRRSQLLSPAMVACVLAGWLVLVVTGTTYIYAKPNQAQHELTQAFAELGVQHCMDRVDDIARHIVNDGEHASMVYYADANPETKMMSLMVGRGGENDNYLATIDFSQNTSCSATYEITKLWSDSCDKVARVAYPDYVLRGAMPGGFQLFESNANLHVALSSLTPDGCLSIQKEMIF